MNQNQDYVATAVRDNIARLIDVLSDIDAALAAGPLTPYTVARLCIEVNEMATKLAGINLAKLETVKS